MTLFDWLRTVPDHLVGPYRSALMLLTAIVFAIAGLAWGVLWLFERWLPETESDHYAPPAAPGPKHRRVS